MNNFLIYFYALTFLKSTYVRSDLSSDYRCKEEDSSSGSSLLEAPELITSYNPPPSGYSQPLFKQISNTKETLITDYYDDIGGLTFSTDFAKNTQRNSGSLLQTQDGAEESISIPIVSKHFYFHTAPTYDEEEEEDEVHHIQIGQPQKNYNVVFINNPSSHSTKAKIVANIAPTEEKTVIYVLSKNNNALDISTEVNTPAPFNKKPEVFFIKYKTPEEAEYAQRIIQSKYEAQGGTSDVSNEGQIPLSSVIGSLENFNANNSETSDTNTQQTYIPPTIY